MSLSVNKKPENNTSNNDVVHSEHDRFSLSQESIPSAANKTRRKGIVVISIIAAARRGAAWRQAGVSINGAPPDYNGVTINTRACWPCIA